MLGRIAESAGLGHSFRHNALMKCSTEKESKQQKGSHPPNTKQNRAGFLREKKKQKQQKTQKNSQNGTAVVWN